MATVIAADPGEAALEVAAVEELVDDFRDDRAQVAVTGLIPFLVDIQEPVEIPLQALPERRGFGLPGTVGLHNHARRAVTDAFSARDESGLVHRDTTTRLTWKRAIFRTRFQRRDGHRIAHTTRAGASCFIPHLSQPQNV